ncbi:MAG: YqaE/Pmp3 family membrane protein, partial [Myxococcota bacterium]
METEGQRDFFRLLAGGVMPPVGVVMQEGVTGTFWLNILLTLMCGFP